MTYKMLRTELWFGRLLRTKQCFPNNHVPVLAVQQKDVKSRLGTLYVAQRLVKLLGHTDK